MIFNSVSFLIFWLVFSVFFFKDWKEKNKYILISAFSLFFYGFWKWEFVFLIILSALIDYFCGAKIYKSSFKKSWLLISVLANLGVLFSFKYFSFFISFLNDLGFNLSIDISNSFFGVLPVGISFYTFQSMSYTIDIYKGDLKPTRSFLKFFSYLSMFPQLVAGPIVRASDILNQMGNVKLQRGQELYFALKLIIYGFFKKTVIADGVAKYVNIAFVRPEYPDSSLYWWSVGICFSIQIYCDFSGYSDIARGLARMYGINFPLNFNHPYIATSFKDFWGRWHISLSSWFRDYVYIPLGGSREGRFKGHLNMWATMLISGLWHGASYTFIVWGALHALYLTVERELYFQKLPAFIRRIIVLKMVIIAWIYFRAEDISSANNIVLKMMSYTGSEVSLGNTISILIVIFLFRELYIAMNFKKSILRDKVHQFEPVWVGILAALSIFCRGEGDTFIYFQF